jgi:hypothetical protein
MLEVCQRGEEKTNLFACLFLQRLPREIIVLLARVEHKYPKLRPSRQMKCGLYTMAAWRLWQWYSQISVTVRRWRPFAPVTGVMVA